MSVSAASDVNVAGADVGATANAIDAVVDGNTVDNNIRRAFDGLKEVLNGKVQKPTYWEKQWDDWGAMVVWILGWLSSMFLFLYFAEGRLNVNMKFLGVVGIFVIWVCLAGWIINKNKTKQMNATAQRYERLNGLLTEIFSAFGWLDESPTSMASRALVTPAHIKAFSELLVPSQLNSCYIM